MYSNIGSYGGAFRRALRSNPSHTWTWQGSADGITWTTLAPIHGATFWSSFGAGNTFRFTLRPENVGKYIRAKIGVRTGGYAYTRVIGKIKAASTTDTVALSFASGHNPPRIGTPIALAALPNAPSNAPVVGIWYRCDAVDDAPPDPGCELVGKPCFIHAGQRRSIPLHTRPTSTTRTSACGNARPPASHNRWLTFNATLWR